MNRSLWVESLEYSGGSLPLRYPLPDGQVAPQKELHCRRTRQPKTPHLGDNAEVEDIWPSVSCSAMKGEPKEAPKDT